MNKSSERKNILKVSVKKNLPYAKHYSIHFLRKKQRNMSNGTICSEKHVFLVIVAKETNNKVGFFRYKLSASK